MEVDFGQERGNSTLDRAQQIAQAELMRRRRRLGDLTEEQESAIETLLLSTVLKTSGEIELISLTMRRGLIQLQASAPPQLRTEHRRMQD